MPKLTRRDFLSSGVAATAGSAMLPGLRPGAVGSGEQPPNILLVMTDQHMPRALGAAGDAVATTPHLDALARSSVHFEHAYCADPVCTPSRASLLTGQYVHTHQAYNNSTAWTFEHQTIAHHLSRAGYMTGVIGKFHCVDAQTHGFDYKLDFNDWYQYLGPKTKLRAEEIIDPNSGSGLPQIDDLWRDFGDPWTGYIERDDREGYITVGRISALPEPDHFESFVERESIRFLRNHGKKQPFFLVSSFLKPHDPMTPSERFLRPYLEQEMHLPASWGKVDPATVPRAVRERLSFDFAFPEIQRREVAKKHLAYYYANLAQADDCIGKLLEALRELDLERDTIVLYTADHGEMLGHHGLWNKTVFYEPAVGVPLLVRVPGMTPPGVRSASPVSLVQVVPTLLELCGVSAPAGLEAHSFVDALREPNRVFENVIYSEDALHSAQARAMIRKGDYKYCHWVNDMPELYNLRDDPEEMQNLALRPEHRATMDRLKEELFSWHAPA